jgi:hypothetical protein
VWGSSAVAEPEISGTLFWFATGAAAFVFPEVAGPSIATTLSTVESFIAAFADSVLSDLLSTFTNSICFPSTPPLLFISFTANSIPSVNPCP